MDLPITHFEILRKTNGNLFRFLGHDLDRLKKSNQRVEDILPPLGECAEDPYCMAFAEHVRSNRHLFPAIRTKENLIAVLGALRAEYRCALAFVHGGSKRFYFAEGLTEGLCCTVLNSPCEHLQLPCPAFMMVYDAPAALDAFSTLMHTPYVEGSVVTCYVREDNLPQFGFRRLHLTAFVMEPDGNSQMLSRQLAMRPDWDLEQALHTDWDSLGKGDPTPPKSQRLNEQGEFETFDTPIESFFQEGLQFIRLMVNSIQYVTSRDAELAERICPRMVAAVPLPKGPGPVAKEPQAWTMVGENIDPVVIDPAHKAEPGTQLHRAGRYRVRFDVLGFWRRHPNTPPDSKRDIWVRPHKRGPEMATLINKPYVVR